jgi:hypothetical protein
MPLEIPIYNINGVLSSYLLTLEPSGDDVRLRIDEEFAGRAVEEELSDAALADLVSGGPQKNFDLLGLTFETDGGEMVHALLSVGSGNYRFMFRRKDVIEALRSMKS